MPEISRFYGIVINMFFKPSDKLYEYGIEKGCCK